MERSSLGIDLIQLQNIIDAEFEKAKTDGKYNLWSTALPNRAEAVRVKQTELKNLLQSLDVQIKEAEATRLKNTRKTDVAAAQIGSGKDTPIVIDDEDESKETKSTVEPKASHATAGKDLSRVTNICRKEEERSAQQDSLETVSRRPLILEQSSSIEQSDADVTISAACSRAPQENSYLSPKSLTEEVSTTREEDSAPAVFTESDISTETASSPITEFSQSSLQDELQTKCDDVRGEKSSQEDSNEVCKELDTKLEITELKNEAAMSSVRPHSPSDFKIGTRVLGKRSSDIWFPGEIIKTMTDKSGQMKYSIKYDKGPKGVLSLNHICPEEPAAVCDVTVGSRVVALYGNLNIWYAGIVAEMACQANRNRLLVFFDDGFAQYLTIKKIHKVHHKGQNVWEDVIEDSRDFIQEYLEEFPSRPMLHVRVGQWIRTEWKGQWLKAKVLSVDGSLVKMLFQIDNRSEWIYRGSTRLDPLYTALVMGEETKSTKARSRKLTRKTSSKDNGPYIEYNITKPCYGVSAYSKTDPQGIHQLQLEEQRQLTQKQHEGLKHSKEESKLLSPKVEKEPAYILERNSPNVSEVEPSHVLERNSSKESEVKPSPPPLEESKSSPTEMGSKDLVVLQDEPVIESTFSCIQASTMRKKTGASLVNNVIFKAISPKNSEAESPFPDIPTPSTSMTVSETTKSQTFLDENIMHAESRPENQWKAPWLNVQRNKQRQGAADNVIDTTVPTQKYHDAATVLKHKFEAKNLTMKDTKRVNEIPRGKSEVLCRSHPVAHTCSFACSRSSSKVSIDPLKHNPLAIPILMDWKREVVKRRGKTNKRDVYYRTPCNRRLRNMTEVLRYLNLTGESSLNVDHFTFDWRVRTDNPITPVAVVHDISNGQENRPLPAVNEVDGTRPPNIQYMSMRQFAPEVKLNTEPGFMVCCDCKDNCADASKCTCIQLTMQGCKAMEMKDIGKMAYQNRRLRDCIQTGIYECNSECSCSKNCLNRVVQNGIQLRLEVFKTENRGWGLRATDDIPAGTFVCTYAGYILNEELANQDGRKYGDEYMAELDYIEVAEKAKEGYESDVSDLEEDDNIIDEMMQSDDNFSYSGNSAIGSRNDDDEGDDEGDEDFSADHVFSFDDDSSSSSTDGVILRGVKTDKRQDVQNSWKGRDRSEESLVVERESKANVLSRLGTPLICILALKRNDDNLKKTSQFLKQYAPVSQTSEQSNKESCKTMNGVSPESTVEKEQKHNKMTDKKTVVESPSTGSFVAKEIKHDSKTVGEMKQEEPDLKEDIADHKDDIPQLVSADDLQRLAATQPKSLQPPVLTRRGTVLDETIEKLKKRVENPDVALDELQVGELKSETCQTFKDISTGGKKSRCHSDKDDDIDRSGTSSPSRNSSSFSQSASSRSSSPAIELINRFKKNEKKQLERKKSSEKEKDLSQGQTSNARYLKTRSLFGEEHCYVIDATFGNCGRFLNHSCVPNLFVQNVFIDTHDMRFPWVAFFAQKNIKAGSELTWDYMYEVGSVRDKSLYCLCGSTACRGRLL